MYELIDKLTKHRSPVRAVAVTADGHRVVSVGDDGDVRIWNKYIGPKDQRVVFQQHYGPVEAIALAPDGQRAVSIGEYGTLFVWNPDTGQNERTLSGHEDQVNAIAVTSEGRGVSGGSDRTLRLWDLDRGNELARAVLDAPITCVAIAPGNPPLVVTGDAAGNVYCLEWVE